MIKAVLFDLDGTLLYTLPDMAMALNHGLESRNLPPRTVEEVRRLEDRVLVPYTKAICQFHVRQIPETEIAEAAPEEIYAQSSERGAGKLGSSGK